MVGFLDLPAELRNEIYSLVAVDSVLKIKPKLHKVFNDQRLVATSAIIAASREINTEYHAILLNRALDPATTVSTLVIDFDYRHLVKFIKDHVASTPARLQVFTDQSKPKLVINLQLDNFDRRNVDMLGKWFLFRKPLGLAFTYKAIGMRGDNFDLYWERFHAMRDLFYRFTEDFDPECVRIYKAFSKWWDEHCKRIATAITRPEKKDFQDQAGFRAAQAAVRQEYDRILGTVVLTVAQRQKKLEEAGFKPRKRWQMLEYSNDDFEEDGADR